MEVLCMNSYELVKELTFERIAGTSDELKALNIIKGKLDELNLESKVEDFKIPYSNVLEQKLTLLESIIKLLLTNSKQLIIKQALLLLIPLILTSSS